MVQIWSEFMGYNVSLTNGQGLNLTILINNGQIILNSWMDSVCKK